MGQEPSPASYLSKDWSELTHAYGSAGNVRALLADLNASDQEVRQKDFQHYQRRLSDRLAVETDEDVRDRIQEALVELKGNQN